MLNKQTIGNRYNRPKNISLNNAYLRNKNILLPAVANVLKNNFDRQMAISPSKKLIPEVSKILKNNLDRQMDISPGKKLIPESKKMLDRLMLINAREAMRR